MPRLELLRTGTLLVLAAVTSSCCAPSGNVAVEEPTPVTSSPMPGAAAQTLLAGLRSSPYGIHPFPDPAWWVDSTASMASRFEGAIPSVIWIVGVIDDDGGCLVNFPPPDDREYPLVSFDSEVDENEEYLNAFDQAGVQVWLQVEPGDADLVTLIDLVLGRYASHPSVVGFGVDVEWYRYSESNPEGVAVSDAEARAWSERVRSHNPNYRLFLKHWLTGKMPPTYRTGVVLVDDSQMFSTLDEMVDEFEVWGQTFAPAPVAFQFGYEADRDWWGDLDDPPADIGYAILDRIPNTLGLYWVDFTAYEIWPRS